MSFADHLLGTVLLLLAVAVLAEGIRVWDGLGGTGFMPIIVGIFFSLLGLGHLLHKPRERDRAAIAWPARRIWQQIGLILLFLFLYALSVPWFGYPVATTLFLTGLLQAMGKVGWRYGLIFGSGVSSITYVIFKVWLNMPLPAGWLGI
jgi:hypothetical protein